MLNQLKTLKLNKYLIKWLKKQILLYYIPVLQLLFLYPRLHPPGGHTPVIWSHGWLTQWQFVEHWRPNFPDSHAKKVLKYMIFWLYKNMLSGVQHNISNMVVVLQEAGTAYPSRAPVFILVFRFLIGWLRIDYLFELSVCFCFVCIRLVSCVSYVTSVYWLSILNCPFCFL